MLTFFIQRYLNRSCSRAAIYVIASTALFLTGCMSVQTNLALYGQEQWSGIQAITLSADFVELMEREGADLSSELSAETESLDEWLQQAQSATNYQNVDVSFNEVEGEDGSLSYVLQADGSQYDALNEVLFQGQADISVADVNGRRQITIRYDAAAATEGSPGTTSQTDEELSAEMLELFGLSIVTRISGGEIISHNADRVEGNTAIWDTPRLIEVTLTEAAQFDPGAITLAEPPASISPSLATLLTAIEDSAASPPSTTMEDSTTAGDSTGDQPDQLNDVATQKATSATDTIAQDSAPATDAETQGPAPSADSATQSSGIADLVAAPPSESQELPTSGAILPENAAAAPLFLAGLVLVALVGSGAIATLGHKN